MRDPIQEAVTRILNMIPTEYRSNEFTGPIPLHACAQQIESLRPSPEQVAEEGEDILGEYHQMTSPGQIVLFWDRIGSIFWHHVLCLIRSGFHVIPDDLKGLAEMTVRKTYVHEEFHHFADVARWLFGGKYVRDIEEALAVAFSYRHLCEKWLRGQPRLRSIVRQLMAQMFHYASPGYRDWHLYQADHDFAGGLVSYLGPASSGFLERNGIDVSGILLAIEPTVRDLGVNTLIVP